jgi:DNA end-binding protein Ku
VPRAIWTGSVSFGLLQVPVQLYTAVRDIDLHFRLLDGRDKKPIRYERVNTDTGEEVPWKDVVKAFEVDKGNYLVVDDDEIKRAAPEQTEAIEIEAFVERCDVDPIFFEKPYYVAPTKAGKRSYVLLRNALRDSGKLAIARVVIRTRQYLAALHPEADALMLTLMRFVEEVVEPSAVGLDEEELGGAKIKPAELEMAQKLLASMSKKWDPADYHDEFRTKLRASLERRAKHDETVEEPPPARRAPEGKVIDLLAVLKNSLEQRGAKPHATRPTRSARTRRASPRRHKAAR